MTTVSASPTIVVNSQLVGGPKMICFTVAAISGDDTADLDFSSYISTEIKHVVNVEIYKAAGLGVLLTKDITTDPKILTITFTDPAADAIIDGCIMVE